MGEPAGTNGYRKEFLSVQKRGCSVRRKSEKGTSEEGNGTKKG
jgi:hypothetical protein